MGDLLYIINNNNNNLQSVYLVQRKLITYYKRRKQQIIVLKYEFRLKFKFPLLQKKSVIGLFFFNSRRNIQKLLKIHFSKTTNRSEKLNADSCPACYNL